MTASAVVRPRLCPPWCTHIADTGVADGHDHAGIPRHVNYDADHTATSYSVALEMGHDGMAVEQGAVDSVVISLRVTEWEMAGPDEPCDHRLTREQAVELITALQRVVDEGDREGWTWDWEAGTARR